jgi:hypothetical protein
MRIHHLNCISARPLGGALMDGHSLSLRGRLASMARKCRLRAHTTFASSNIWRIARCKCSCVRERARLNINRILWSPVPR